MSIADMVYGYSEVLKTKEKEKIRLIKYRYELINKLIETGFLKNRDCIPDNDFIFNMIPTYDFFKEIIIEKRILSNEKRKLNKSIKVNANKKERVRL